MKPVEHRIAAVLTDVASARVCAVLRYEPDCPYEVRLWLTGSSQPSWPEPGWVFARDLLVDGLHHRVGVGSVRITPLGASFTRIDLVRRHDIASLTLHTEPLRDFVQATMDLVPPQTEGRHFDWELLGHTLLHGHDDHEPPTTPGEPT